MKSQSAMEYLMTYGWAILIIAVVLTVLFQLGVFSGGNFQPHAQAGSCEVVRTSAAVSLEGECQGQEPEFVAQFNNNAYIQILKSSSLNYPESAITLAIWMYETGTGTNCPRLIDGGNVNAEYTFVASCPNILWRAETSGGAPDINSGTTSLNTWYFIVAEYDGSNVRLYINGQQVGTGSASGTLQTSGAYAYIGGDSSPSYFQGYLANAQIYNVSLSNAEITALYNEGIGGAPIRPQNLIAWYPLNGNANDYSGNNSNGAAIGVTYSSSWESSYTAP